MAVVLLVTFSPRRVLGIDPLVALASAEGAAYVNQRTQRFSTVTRRRGTSQRLRPTRTLGWRVFLNGWLEKSRLVQ
jgi:hypothetical protein